jgi:hypothetical protein
VVPRWANERFIRMVGVFIGGCVRLIILGVMSVRSGAGVSSVLLPIGLTIVLVTTMEFLIVRRR